MSVIVFDAYGTLFNVDALQSVAAQFVGERADEFQRVWRDKQLAYAWRSTLMNRYQDFDKLTQQAFLFTLRSMGVHNEQIACAKLIEAHDSLPVYDDVKTTLDALNATSHKLVVLSNGTFRALQKLASAENILFSFDYLLSSAPLRTYKPARAAYQLVIDTTHCEKTDVIFVSSNGWDISGAKAFGFHSIWCNRQNAVSDTLGPQPDNIITDLHELPSLLQS
ncbi:haloacid dehalogenase type II [Alicyclobacillus fodiniaquatilis]|uniref:Haloacid dehalogenase type II n=1 Tax=Alicyclobacillus fodiniaquatilis TaxID=1661150 RepID=A0ABW4JPT9_9BACL